MLRMQKAIINSQMYQTMQHARQARREMAALAVSLWMMFGGYGWLTVNYLQASPIQYFVATNGSASGDGSESKPWDLTSALKNTAKIKPGDTLWIRGGTYGSGGATSFQATLKGTAQQPVIVRAYKGERATINGHIEATAASAHIWFWGLEVTNSLAERKIAGSQRLGGFSLFGPGSKVINSIIHNTGHPGVGFWSTVGDGGEIYGTLMWGIGTYDTEVPGFEQTGNVRGSPIYAQNQTGNRYIKDNITFRNFTTAMKAYTQGGYANGFQFEGNILFDAQEFGLFVAAEDYPVNSVVVKNNYTYSRANESAPAMYLGYYSSLQGSATVTDNYFIGGLTTNVIVKNWQQTNFTNNTVISRRWLNNFTSTYPDSTYNMSGNTWISTYSQPFNKDNAAMTATQWQALYPQSGIISSALPTQNRVFVRKNQYDANRGHVAVYNWENKTSVDIDISSIVKPGQYYEIRDAQNYYGPPVTSGKYNGKATVPMNTTQVAPITGTVTHFTNTHTPTEFGAFVVLAGEEAVAATKPVPAASSPGSTPSKSSTPPSGSSNAANLPQESAPETDTIIGTEENVTTSSNQSQQSEGPTKTSLISKISGVAYKIAPYILIIGGAGGVVIVIFRIFTRYHPHHFDPPALPPQVITPH